MKTQIVFSRLTGNAFSKYCGGKFIPHIFTQFSWKVWFCIDLCVCMCVCVCVCVCLSVCLSVQPTYLQSLMRATEAPLNTAYACFPNQQIAHRPHISHPYPFHWPIPRLRRSPACISPSLSLSLSLSVSLYQSRSTCTSSIYSPPHLTSAKGGEGRGLSAHCAPLCS